MHRQVKAFELAVIKFQPINWFKTGTGCTLSERWKRPRTQTNLSKLMWMARGHSLLFLKDVGCNAMFAYYIVYYEKYFIQHALI